MAAYKTPTRHGVPFRYRCNLRLNGHRYQPDFMFGSNTILEVTGLATESYWARRRRKIDEYIKASYEVCLVASNYTYDKVSYQPLEGCWLPGSWTELALACRARFGCLRGAAVVAFDLRRRGFGTHRTYCRDRMRVPLFKLAIRPHP